MGGGADAVYEWHDITRWTEVYTMRNWLIFLMPNLPEHSAAYLSASSTSSAFKGFLYHVPKEESDFTMDFAFLELASGGMGAPSGCSNIIVADTVDSAQSLLSSLGYDSTLSKYTYSPPFGVARACYGLYKQ